MKDNKMLDDILNKVSNGGLSERLTPEGVSELKTAANSGDCKRILAKFGITLSEEEIDALAAENPNWYCPHDKGCRDQLA